MLDGREVSADRVRQMFSRGVDARLEQHMRECDRRYQELESRSRQQHEDNTRRFTAQDLVLEKVRTELASSAAEQRSTLSRILIGVLASLTTAIVGVGLFFINHVQLHLP